MHSTILFLITLIEKVKFTHLIGHVNGQFFNHLHEIKASLFNQIDDERISRRFRYTKLVLRHISLHLFTSKGAKKSEGKQNSLESIYMKQLLGCVPQFYPALFAEMNIKS